MQLADKAKDKLSKLQDPSSLPKMYELGSIMLDVKVYAG